MPAANVLNVSESAPIPPLKTAVVLIAVTVALSSAEPVLRLVTVPVRPLKVTLPVTSEASTVVRVVTPVAFRLMSDAPLTVTDFKGAPARSTLLAAPEAVTVIFWMSGAVTVTNVEAPEPKAETPKFRVLSVVVEI